MGNDKPTVTALREIEQGLVNYDTLEAQALAEQQRAQSEEFSFVTSALSE
jgi:DNA-directed RNA polymerase subunit omega